MLHDAGGGSGRGVIDTYANGINGEASAVTFNINAGGTSYLTNTGTLRN